VEVVEGAVDHTRFDWPQPSAVVFGNEVKGVPVEVVKRCDAAVTIPMRGFKNTINVATAFGIVLYEILRRWGRV
jgi:tRNA G18 (ribose-2'-O)-methylase SpoU